MKIIIYLIKVYKIINHQNKYQEITHICKCNVHTKKRIEVENISCRNLMHNNVLTR